MKFETPSEELPSEESKEGSSLYEQNREVLEVQGASINNSLRPERSKFMDRIRNSINARVLGAALGLAPFAYACAEEVPRDPAPQTEVAGDSRAERMQARRSERGDFEKKYDNWQTRAFEMLEERGEKVPRWSETEIEVRGGVPINIIIDGKKYTFSDGDFTEDEKRNVDFSNQIRGSMDEARRNFGDEPNEPKKSDEGENEGPRTRKSAESSTRWLSDSNDF
jgi:hypothetical protein